MSTVQPQFYQQHSDKVWDDLIDETCPIKAPERKARMKALGEYWKANQHEFKSPNEGYVDTGE